MARRIRINVGRQRRGGNIKPSEAGYIGAINAQMTNITRNFTSLVEGIENATPEALVHGLRPMFNESQVLVPVKTGRLKASGFLEAEHGSSKGRGGRALIGYALAGNPMYAVIQHERLDFAHTAPTQAKYLEEAANRKLHLVPRRIRTFMRRLTGVK